MRAKKILILITSLLCLLLWACGSGEKENSPSNNSWFDEMKTMNNQVSNNENETNKKDNKEDETPKGTEENTENKSKYLNVVGLYGDVAQDMLEREGFKVEVRREESNDVESGTVISQYPSPKDNKEMSPGDTVILVVCSGKKESTKYSRDVQALDAIKTAMSVLIADRTSDYSVVDGKVNSLSVLMKSSYNNKKILNEVLSEVFDQNGYFNALSLVFKGIKTSDVKIYVKRGAVSILVPVNEEYSKY